MLILEYSVHVHHNQYLTSEILNLSQISEDFSLWGERGGQGDGQKSPQLSVTTAFWDSLSY